MGSCVAEAMATLGLRSSKGLGLMRGVIENISWTQTELELNPVSTTY